MFFSALRILVSTTTERHLDSNDVERQYSPRSSNWMLTIERQRRFALGKRRLQYLYCSVLCGQEQSKFILRQENRSPPGVASHAILNEETHFSVERIIRMLENKTRQYNAAFSWNTRLRLNSESWIRLALYALIENGVIEHFDIREFMDFARSFFDSRLESSAGTIPPCFIRYPMDRERQIQHPRNNTLWPSFTIPASVRYEDFSYSRLG